MSMQALSLDARLALDKYEIDEQSHIQVDQSRCQLCELKPCVTVCPARVYKWVDGRIAVNYENCLECGTCQVACDSGGNRGIHWRYPRGGYGILYRCG